MPVKNLPHPGLSVRHDCLEPLGLSVAEGARKLGVSRKQLPDIVNGRGYRIYFGRDGNALIILMGAGTKVRQWKDIETAKRRWQNYKRRKSQEK